MISKPQQDAFNDHLRHESESAYLYLAMSAWLDAKGLAGMAHWMRMQAQEELSHFFRFYRFLVDRQGKVRLATLEAPVFAWETPLDVFEHTYRHECEVSERINELADLAIKNRDHAAGAFLQWFITEQVEEEATTSGIVDRLRIVGDDGRGILMIDQELGRRTFSPIPGFDLTGPLYP